MKCILMVDGEVKVQCQCYIGVLADTYICVKPTLYPECVNNVIY